MERVDVLQTVSVMCQAVQDVSAGCILVHGNACLHDSVDEHLQLYVASSNRCTC